MGQLISITVHVAELSTKKTAVELFPDPEAVVAKWNDDLAARVLPVCSFDLALAGDKGRCVFLYHEDTGRDFLEFKTDGKLVTSIKDWKSIKPFEAPPSLKTLRAEKARWLALTEYTVNVPEPESLGSSAWASAFETALKKAGVQNFNAPRLGASFPCYVQSTISVTNDPGLVGELYGGFLGLASMFFYLSNDGKSFQQQMQMT